MIFSKELKCLICTLLYLSYYYFSIIKCKYLNKDSLEFINLVYINLHRKSDFSNKRIK